MKIQPLTPAAEHQRDQITLTPYESASADPPQPEPIMKIPITMCHGTSDTIPRKRVRHESNT